MAVCHSTDGGWKQVEDLTTLSDLRAESGTLLWAEADVASLTEEEIALVAEEFGLHELAVEDAVNARQRPKLERYRNHLFLVLHQLDEINDQLEAVQISCFIGNRYVLTLHSGAERTIAAARSRWEEDGAKHKSPSDLIHTLVDVVVDDYQEIADRLEDEMEELEEVVLEEPQLRVQRQLYSLKQRLSRLRRYVFPATRLIDWALDADSTTKFSAHTVELFRDVHDHLLRITDQIRNIDELSQAVLDLTRSAQTEVLNETGRKLSAWAAIFAVGTLIGGIYGMNFQLVPDEQSIEGFWFAIGLMFICSASLYIYFKRRRWL